LHCAAEVAFRRLDDQVIMLGHERFSVPFPA
jgi:hypothetical protein